MKIIGVAIMTENKRYVRILDHSEKEVRIFDEHNQKNIFNIFFMGLDSAICLKGALEDTVDLLNELSEEIEQLKNKIDVLEDDNETYHKSLEKLNLYTKRFIPTRCTNEFKDCKTNRYYWLDHEGNFEGCLELLNLLDCEREVLESENRQLKGRLMEYEEQINGG